MKGAGISRKEREGEKMKWKEGEEEKGRESHACLHVCPFGLYGKKGDQGLILLLYLTTSGPGSPAHSHKHMVSQLLPLATFLERKTLLM